MQHIPEETPVIIGVGQYAERLGAEWYLGLSPLDLAARALVGAIQDCGAAGSVAGAIDTVAAIRQFELSVPGLKPRFGASNNPPRSIASRAGVSPRRAILEVVGGQGSQRLIGELAQEIAAGRCHVAAVVGAEAMSTERGLRERQGGRPDWSESVAGSLEDRGYGVEGLLEPTLRAHGVVEPVAVYALFENARRSLQGLTLSDYRLEMGRLFAPFTNTAAANPFAASAVVRTPQEIATVSERNRIVAEPYTRLCVARDQVNQGAAVVLASVGAARALGVPADQWVYVHGVAETREVPVLSRPELATSPASLASVLKALQLSRLEMSDVRYLDLYSCFPIAVFNLIEALGISADDSRGLTLAGGLPYFGGPGNNYATHAIVEAVQRLRLDGDSYALVGANGGYMSKYVTGVYSRRPARWDEVDRFESMGELGSRIPIVEHHEGPAVLETYTVQPHKQGTAGVMVCRTPVGQRLIARTVSGDDSTLALLQQGDVFGRTVWVEQDHKKRNIARFEKA